MTKTLIHAYVTSRLDYCNGMLYGLPKDLISKLQSVLNTAARLVSLTRKYDSITPVMQDLHWLPIESRIKFKVLLQVLKSLRNNLGPGYLSDKFLLKLACGLRSDDQNLLLVQVFVNSVIRIHAPIYPMTEPVFHGCQTDAHLSIRGRSQSFMDAQRIL